MRGTVECMSNPFSGLRASIAHMPPGDRAVFLAAARRFRAEYPSYPHPCGMATWTRPVGNTLTIFRVDSAAPPIVTYLVTKHGRAVSLTHADELAARRMRASWGTPHG